MTSLISIIEFKQQNVIETFTFFIQDYYKQNDFSSIYSIIEFRQRNVIETCTVLPNSRLLAAEHRTFQIQLKGSTVCA